MILFKKKKKIYFFSSFIILLLIFILIKKKFIINNSNTSLDSLSASLSSSLSSPTSILINKNSNYQTKLEDYANLLTKYNQLLVNYHLKEDENNELHESIDELYNKIREDILHMESNRIEYEENLKKALKSLKQSNNNFNFYSNIQGVIVLGMHRSGTSMLSGLLTKLGLNTGEPLIPPNFDNEKGFFERIDVVNMNDKLFRLQNINYATRISKFNFLKSIHDVMKAEIENNFDNKIQLIGTNKNVSIEMRSPKHTINRLFLEGRNALEFLNNPDNSPWMLKDPRLCVTLKFWLSLLNRQPAIIFSYRHPFDVASSLKKREKFEIGYGLKLWYVYNKMAIKNSQDLCRVIVSNKDLLTNTMSTMEKIKKGLRECGMALTEVANKFSEKDANEFIDLSLQHSHGSTEDLVCKNVMDKIDLSRNYSNIENGNNNYFYNLDFFDSIELPSRWEKEDALRHYNLYRETMRLYCALENGEAYLSDFPFNEELDELNQKY